MSNPETLVIGSGAGGATAFSVLASDGHDVMLIEEGRDLSKAYAAMSVSDATVNLYRNGGATPVYGLPTIAFGEGVCLGGTTEINGGLFWRTPEWILDRWVSSGLTDLSQSNLNEHFEWLETRLGVREEPMGLTSNRDSYLLELGARNLGWSVSAVPRAAPNCSHANRCGSGCPSGAKSSMSGTLIADGQRSGGRVVDQLRALKITSDASSRCRVELRDQKTGSIHVLQPKRVVVAGGATQSSALLRRSRLVSGDEAFRLHINLKVVARFPEVVSAQNGTIFSRQIQEFAESDGVLIMPTNLQGPYLAMSAAHLPGSRIIQRMSEIDHLALFTAQIEVTTRGITRYQLGKRFMHHKLGREDWRRIRFSLRCTSEMAFAAGANRLDLPLSGTHPCVSVEEAIAQIQEAHPRQFQLTSVHMMSSNPMGVTPDGSIVNPSGQLWNHENVYVLDSSILPTTTCESPQGTIMACVRQLSRALCVQ